MKLSYFVFDETEKALKIRIVAETQKEACELIKAANRIKAPAQSSGRVSETETFMWLTVSTKDVPFGVDYFGTEKM